MLKLKVKHVEGNHNGISLHDFEPPLLYEQSPEDGVHPIVSPMVYISSEVSVNSANPSNGVHYKLTRGSMLSVNEVFFGAVQYVADDVALMTSAARTERTIYDFYPELKRGSSLKMAVWVVAWSPEPSGIHLFQGVRSQDAPWPIAASCSYAPAIPTPLAAGPGQVSPVRISHE